MICAERYEGSDGQIHRCSRPAGHAHGHDAAPAPDAYYCQLHRCAEVHSVPIQSEVRS